MTSQITAGITLGLLALSTTAARASEGAIDVQCRAVNDFGYVATASGTLRPTSRTQPSVFFVSGSLEINAKFFGDPDQNRHVQVQGTVDISGQYLFADVLSGADELESMFFAFSPGTSDIRSKNGTEYQTECSASSVNLPKVADLVLGSSLRYESLADGSLRAQIAVNNAGNTTVTGPAARVRIAGRDVSATLPNALAAGQSGSLQVDLPANTLARCGTYYVILDLDHTLQSGAFDPFANDSGQVSSPCLRWSTPISDDALGVSADPLIRGLTLESIVNSEAVARADGNRCSACHSAGSGNPYSPPAGRITPSQNIGGRSWAGAGGWVDAFDAQAIKPEYLKQAFRRWRDDGAL